MSELELNVNEFEKNIFDYELLKQKAKWVRKETLKIHKKSPGTRIASSLSDVDIFVSLYYGKILDFNSKNPLWDKRDRIIVSKGHGAVSLYPILADLEFFDKEELENISDNKTFLGNIPDTTVPGIETINGSMGHGLGVACGVALGLKNKNINKKVFVISGDGELNEGAVWEAVMFASFHKLNNLILILDENKMSMRGYQKNILGLSPYEDKFESFNWMVKSVDGHDFKQLCETLYEFKEDKTNKPKILIARTIKGKGVAELENDELCHIRTFTSQEVDKILERFS